MIPTSLLWSGFSFCRNKSGPPLRGVVWERPIRPRHSQRLNDAGFHFVQATVGWLLATLKRVVVFFPTHTIFYLILFLLFPDITLYRFCVYSDRAHVKPVAQKFRFPNLYFKFACRSNIIIALFPFRYPINCDTLYLGGMLTSRCTWSGIICPSIISTPFHRHKSFMIFCISSLNWL